MTALVYGSNEYPELSRMFEVVTVPKIWINDRVYLVGSAPTKEMMAMTMVNMIKQALSESGSWDKSRTGRD